MNGEIKREKGDSGFTIRNTIEGEVLVVRMRAWGFWEPEMAEQWKAAAYQAFNEAKVAGKRRWCVLVDNTGFLPQRDSTKATIGEVMATALRMGMSRSAVVQGETLTKLQLARLGKEAGVPGLSFHTSEGDALAALVT